jgi:hypothetical protein
MSYELYLRGRAVPFYRCSHAARAEGYWRNKIGRYAAGCKALTFIFVACCYFLTWGVACAGVPFVHPNDKRDFLG